MIPIIPDNVKSKDRQDYTFTNQDKQIDTVRETVAIKLRNATFEKYRQKWNDDVFILQQNTIRNSFYKLFLKYQFIEVNGEIMHMVNYLMCCVSDEFINKLLYCLGFGALRIHENVTASVVYNLLWHLNNANKPFNLSLTHREKAYISELNVEDLLTLLGIKYDAPKDHASLIFTSVSGYCTQHPECFDRARYEEVSRIPPNIIWEFAKKFNIIDRSKKIISFHSPYMVVSLEQPLTIEAIITSVSKDNIEEYMELYGIVMNDPPFWISPILRFQYFYQEIIHYEPILSRGQVTDPPPISELYNRDVLSIYTLKELIDRYEPIGRWHNRKQLIDVIFSESRHPQWSWRNRCPINNDTINIITGELHADTDVNDPSNPTVSYGVAGAYRSYQVDELLSSWSNKDDYGCINFIVPDWRPEQTNNVRYYPIDSIRQLLQMLICAPENYDVSALILVIKHGLDSTVILNSLKLSYDNMNPQQKNAIGVYSAWLFCYSMWMRFWEGPGDPWPVKLPTEHIKSWHRDQHLWIQQSIHSIFLESHCDDVVKRWIDTLPLIEYNFEIDWATISHEVTVNFILEKVQLGDLCVLHASDLILGTSFFLLKNMLNFIGYEPINEFLCSMITILADLELQVINHHLPFIKDVFSEKSIVLNERRNKLLLMKTSPINQPYFHSQYMKLTGHEDYFAFTAIERL